MAKPMLVTLPFIMLLLDYWPLERWQKASTPVNVPALANKRAGKKKSKQRKAESLMEKKTVKPIRSGHQLIGNLLWEKVPFFFLAMILSIALIWQQQTAGGIASLQQVSFSNRIINAIVSYISYLGKTFWPFNLAVIYPYEFSLPLWQVLGASLLLLGISIAAIYSIKKAPFFFIGWLWYLVTLFPVIGLLQAGSQAMADRYTYLPSIGIAIMLVWGIVYLLPREKMRKIIIIPGTVILAALTFLTWQQCGYWKNSIELFNHALKVTNNNFLAHASFGVALADEGRIDEAIVHYIAAIKIIPDYSDAHYNLALAFEKQGKLEEAIAHYREALRTNSDNSSAHINLGVILGKQLKHNEALYHFRQALRIDPDDPGIYLSLGIALANTGKLNEAIEYFRQAIYLNPNYEEARRALRLTMEIEQKRRH